MDPARDITLVENTPIDYLDFASPSPASAPRWASTPETNRDRGRKLRMSAEIVELVTRKWPDYGLPGSGNAIWERP